MALTILNETEFRNSFRKDPSGGYLFFGEEDYTKAACLRAAREQVLSEDPSLSCFNDVRPDGASLTPDALTEILSAPPIGAARKIVTISGLPLNDLRQGELERLCAALAEIPSYPYCTVILSAAAGDLDEGYLPRQPSPLLTALAKRLTPVRFERNAPQRLAAWVRRHYLHHGVEASDALCRLTVERCGRDMFTLSGEIDKTALFVLADGRTTLTEADLRAASVPTAEYAAFAFADALMERRAADALEILSDLRFRRVEPLLVFGEISRTVCDLASVRAMADAGQTAPEIARALKMHEFRAGLCLRRALATDPRRLNRAVSLCGKADRALKSSGADPYGALEELICAL